MTASDAYVLPFRADFDAPPGAVLECRGTRGWRYRDPRGESEVTFHDDQPNSYARSTGGMVGTLWVVAEVRADPSRTGGGVLVTLEPA